MNPIDDINIDLSDINAAELSVLHNIARMVRTNPTQAFLAVSTVPTKLQDMASVIVEKKVTPAQVAALAAA